MSDTGQISDGYHTFDELYQHRTFLFCALMNAYPAASWKSHFHADGTSYEGWFIAGMDLPQGQITYHCPEHYWHLAKAQELPKAPPWDGHTSGDVLERLAEFIDPH